MSTEILDPSETQNEEFSETVPSLADNTIDEDIDKEFTETKENDESEKVEEEEKEQGNLRLPLARIRKIMKADPTLEIASQDSVFVIAKATELFIESLVVESLESTLNNKKKTISKRDFDVCLEKIDSLAFLDGALED